MKDHSVKPEIAATRSGYIIRFTCPACNAENSIINKIPRDHVKVTRDAACHYCKKKVCGADFIDDTEPCTFSGVVAGKSTGNNIICPLFFPSRDVRQAAELDSLYRRAVISYL